MSGYWSKRQIEQQKKLFDKTLMDINEEIAFRYRQTMRRIKAEMTSLYNEIMANKKDDTVLASDLYRYNKYYELVADFNTQLSRLGQSQINILSGNLVEMYKSNQYIVGKSLGISSQINVLAAEKVVNTLWCSDGLSYSERIWRDKQRLADSLEQGLIDCVSKGATVDDLTKQILNDFETSYSNANRLARTELSYVQNQSTIDKYIEAGVNKLKIIGTADDRECEECADVAGVIYDINDAPQLPLHCNCRCAYVAVLED